MLSRRLQTLLNIRERAILLRLYLAGSHVQPNLRTQFTASRNQSFSAIKPLVSVHRTQNLFTGVEKVCVEITRGAHSSTDDNVSPEILTENNYARSVLANSKKAPKTIGLPLETIETVSDKEAEEILSHDWKASSAEEILEAFKRLSCHAKTNSLSFSPDKHNAILVALSEKIQDLKNEQLLQVFQHLLLWKDVQWEKGPGFTDLWWELDRACIKRMPVWSIEDALLYCDYWFQLRLFRKSKYGSTVLKALGNKPKKLNTINFLHFMFLLNVGRKPPINMYEIEYRFDSIVEEFTPNELGVISMAFFKTQSPFRDQKIVARMLEKVLNEWDEVEDIGLSAIMKMTRYSMGLKELKILNKVLNRVKSRVSDLSIPCLTHIAHAAASIQCYNAELMQLIIERIERDIDSARLKDMERVCWTLSIFNYSSNTLLYHKVVESLRNPNRKEEIERFPAIVATTLMHLSHAGIFPIDLIKEVLDPAFLRKVYGNNMYKIGWDFFALENNVKIEVPEYDGPLLKDSIREFLAKKYAAAIVQSKEKAKSADKLILEVAHMCKLALGSETAIHIDQVLPHFMKPDLIVCLDEANNPVAPEPILSKMSVGSIKYPPQESRDLRWIAVVLGSQNQLLKGSNKYIGLLSSKLKQLKIIGYTPLVVPFNEWREIQSLEAKQNYLKNLLSLVSDRKVSAKAL